MPNVSRHNMQTLLSKYKTNFIINAYLILTAALIVTGGIFLLATAVHLDIMTAFIVAASTGLGAMVYPIIIIARRFTCLREDINRKIRMIGEGRLDKPLEISREGMFVDIADSVNVANEKLTDRLQSIIQNTNRLSQVEEELSSLFRPRNASDKYTRDLVCKLKICTSRLKNDLEDFYLCEEKESAGRTE